MALRTLGDVLARSGPCITISEDDSIRTLALALAKHRVDAVSVLSDADAALTGIATARDVAKAIARNLDLDSTTVALVMTPNPITLPPHETPANALALMRQGRFRHIPVLAPNDSTSVLGIVDVLSLAYDAITRLQLTYSMIPSRRGYDLLRAARETMEKPTLRPILDRTPLTTLPRTATIAAACELIVTKHVAAIVVVDSNGVLDGIFTCTDIVKRIVVRGRDPTTVTLAEVMTANPDCASPDFTILESLQRMQACGFRHLPVVDDHSRVVVGIVDVLQLASDTLLDLNAVAGARTQRALSTATATPAPSSAMTRLTSFSTSPAVRAAAMAGGSSGRPGLGRGLATFFSSLFSNSFAQRQTVDGVGAPSVPREALGTAIAARASVDVSREDVASRFAGVGGDVAIVEEKGLPTRKHYGYKTADVGGRGRHARADVPLASFKFKDVNGDFRRIKVPMELEKGDFDQFMLDVRRRYIGSGIAGATVGSIKIKYVDEDGDDVLIANDDDLASCFEDVVDVKGKTIQLKVEEVEGSAPCKMQSPVSSAPSSTVGSPGRGSVSSMRQEEGLLKPSVEPPPPTPTKGMADGTGKSGDAILGAAAVKEAERDTQRRTGVYRTRSKPVIHTPSSLKANEGHQLMLDRRIEEAIVAFTEALQLDEGNARAKGERGAAHLLAGNSVEAEEDYRGAIGMLECGKGGKKGDMTYQMCVVGLVECLIDQRRYEEAVAVAGRMEREWGNTGCVDALRDEVESSSNAGRKALEAGEFGEGMSLYTNALRVESGYLELVSGETGRASLRLGRAKCYKGLEDYDMALEDYEAAVLLEPESVAGHKGCGKCLMELEQTEKALEAYERANKLDGGDEEVIGAMKTIKAMLPDPMETKREEIAKLGALLGSMNLPKKAK